MARQTAFVLLGAKPQYIVTNSDKCNLRTPVPRLSKWMVPEKQTEVTWRGNALRAGFSMIQ